MCWSTSVSTGVGRGYRQGVVRSIHFGMYNTQNGWNGGLESALRGMSQANMELGVFQETKLTKLIYTFQSSGYTVVATEALRAHSGGVAVFYRAVEPFFVEALHTYRANIVSFQLASGDSQWFIVGFYLAQYNASTIEDVAAAISQRLRGSTLLVVINFNTNLAAPEGRDQGEGI